MTSVYDGIVSRHVNRRVSRPIARLLSHTPATPNQISVLSLAIAVGAFVSFFYGLPIVGGLLAQLCSIVDDGKRVPMDLKKGDTVIYSKFGGTEYEEDGEEYLTMKEADVLAKIS